MIVKDARYTLQNVSEAPTGALSRTRLVVSTASGGYFT